MPRANFFFYRQVLMAKVRHHIKTLFLHWNMNVVIIIFYIISTTALNKDMIVILVTDFLGEKNLDVHLHLV